MIEETKEHQVFTKAVPKPPVKEKKPRKFIKRKAGKKKKRKKKIRYLPISKLKDICWKVFSRYIRAVRDAAQDQIGFSVCYTCGKEGRWQELQCGHYESRVGSGTFIDERNNHAQCEGCNMWKKGNLRVYAKNLVRDYGKNILEDLAAQNQKPLKLAHEEWVRRILKYERKLKEAGVDCPPRPEKLTVD